MTLYTDFEFETDPDLFIQDAFDYIASLVPGFDPAAGNLETVLIEALAHMIAELRDVATDVPVAIFRSYGATLAGVPPIDAAAATATTTWTFTDTAAHIIPADTVVSIADAAGEPHAFVVTDEYAHPAGTNVTPAGAVAITAVDEGADASGLTAVPELIDPLAFVSSIALVGSTSGGVDAEEDDAYLNRLVTRLQLQAPRPILPPDFTVFAREVATVYRAVTIDGYNPTDQTYGNERMVAVAAIDDAGNPVSQAPKDAIDADLEARREVNFVVSVIDPTLTAVAVTFTAVAYAGFDTTAVRDEAVASVLDKLSPVSWGTSPFGDPRDWTNTTTVRISEVYEAINRTDGVNYVTDVTLNGARVDVALPGAVPLPVPSASGTVT